MMYKYCKRCGRRLKGEENRRRGYGEICYQKAHTQAQDSRQLLVPDRLPVEIITND